MANDVGVNSQSVVTKKSKGIIANGPDVCKTPSPGGPVPIPYPNISKSGDLDKGTKSVKVNDVPACLKGSNFSKSTGDEAGTAGGGVVSSKTAGIAEPINFSFDVKIEGKNVVRNMDLFLSNKKNTPPAPVMQAPIAPVLAIKEEKEKLFKCEWKNCQGKHTSDVNDSYPKNGSVKRGKTSSGNDYSSDWVSKGLEPWAQGKQKHDPKATFDDYKNDLQRVGTIKPKNKSSIDSNLKLIKAGKYKTEKHHIISIHLFDNLSSLAHNCKLIGYNVNDFKNGICLPYFVPDIVRHDRQAHRSSHPPAYDKNAMKLLENLQTRAEDFCSAELQEKLVRAMNKTSDRIRDHIINWDKGWTLRAASEAERTFAYMRIGLPVPKKRK